MCVRTKNSFGCGHATKETIPCQSSSCEGLERFLIERDGDCSRCRAGGATITRGIDGKGRYAQEHRLGSLPRSTQQEQQRQSPSTPKYQSQYQVPPPRSSNPEMSTRRNDINPIPSSSPWSPKLSGEKEWETYTRRKADDAWLREHQDRQSFSASSSSSEVENTSSRSRPQRQTDDTEAARIRRELRRIQDVESRIERRRKERQDSADSFESFDGEGWSSSQVPRGHGQSQVFIHGLSSSKHHGHGGSYTGHDYRSGHHGHSYNTSHSHRSGSGSGSYDSGVRTIITDPYGYGYGYSTTIIDSTGYTTGLGQGISSIVRDAKARRKRW